MMYLFQRIVSLARHNVIFIGAITAVSIVVLLTLTTFLPQSESGTAVNQPGESTLSADLGMTYLLITPRVASYYGLATDHGVLVTEVTKGSLADLSGVQVGDVILSYNGTHLREGTHLFGMMQGCPAGSTIALDIQRANSARTIELFHAKR